MYCRVSYSMSGLESDAKVQTRLMFLFIEVSLQTNYSWLLAATNSANS